MEIQFCSDTHPHPHLLLRTYKHVPYIRCMPTNVQWNDWTRWLTWAQDAVASLNTLQSNFTIIDAIRKSGRKMNEQAIPEMIEWCKKIGYEVWTHPFCYLISVLKLTALRTAVPFQLSQYNTHSRYERERLNVCFHILYPHPIHWYISGKSTQCQTYL